MTLHPPPDPLKRSANFFQRLDWLVNQAALWLVEEALNTRHQLEAIMADLTAFNAALVEFKAEVATHATKIDTQLAQLLTAQGSGDQAAIDAAAADIRNETSALQAMDVSLDADDTNPAAGV